MKTMYQVALAQTTIYDSKGAEISADYLVPIFREMVESENSSTFSYFGNFDHLEEAEKSFEAVENLAMSRITFNGDGAIIVECRAVILIESYHSKSGRMYARKPMQYSVVPIQFALG